MTLWKITFFVIVIFGILSTFIFYDNLISTSEILLPKLSNGQQCVNTTAQSNQTTNKEIMDIFNTQEVDNNIMPNSNIKCNNSFKASHLMTIGDFYGRTGNHMFTLIMLLSSARRYCYTPVLKPSVHLDSIFDFSESSLKRSSNISIKMFRNFTDENGLSMGFIAAIGNLSTHYNWSFQGYFQSWRYFFEQQDFIKTQFIFKPYALENAIKILKQINSTNVIKISVHVRRGDMTTTYSKRQGFGIPDATYISNAMSYFRHKYHGLSTVFIFVSDDIRWCKSHFKSADVIFSDGKSVGTDLALLSLSDDAIITSGSFGWLGAWLCGGDVVYYKGYPTKGTFIGNQFSEYDYYPQNWLGLW